MRFLCAPRCCGVSQHQRLLHLTVAENNGSIIGGAQAGRTKRASCESLRALSGWLGTTGGVGRSDGAARFRDLLRLCRCDHNPRRLLTEVSEFRLMQMATDPHYCSRVSLLSKNYRASLMIAPGRAAATDTTERGRYSALNTAFRFAPLYSADRHFAGDHLKRRAIYACAGCRRMLYRTVTFANDDARRLAGRDYGVTHPECFRSVVKMESVALFMSKFDAREDCARAAWRVDVDVAAHLLVRMSPEKRRLSWVTGLSTAATARRACAGNDAGIGGCDCCFARIDRASFF